MRLPDWEQRLGAFMEVNRERAFRWGEWDCALFATAAAAAITGEDRAAAFRGQYDTRKGSAAALRKHGKGTLLRTLDSLFVRKEVGYAQRGDLIWREGCVGVCLGSTAAFLSEPDILDIAGAPRLGTMILLPRPMWQKVWAV